jgi:type I restriction enzyme S subunit
MTQPLVLHTAEETLEAVQTRRHAAYPAYKPSGVEWLGEVPEHWDVKRLKFLVQLVNAKVEADEETTKPYIGMEHIESWTGKLRLPDDVFVPTGVSNVFRSGDVLFGKLRPYLAKATTVDFGGLCSSELMVLRSEGTDRHFLLYALLSDGFIKLVNSSTYGSKMPRANWEFIGGMLTPAPPLEEQQAIARFLDEQTRKIDDLIEAKRSLLDLLKEKRQAVITNAVTRGLDPAAKLEPSGVEWLGDVPEHWEVKRLKWSSLDRKGGVWGEEPDDEDTGIICIRVADFDRTNLRVKIENPTLRSIPVKDLRGRLLKKGDLLLEKSGGGEKQLVGSVMLFDHDVRAVNSNFVARMTPSPGYDSHFLVYLHSCLYSSRINFRSIKQTTGIQNLDSDAYLNEKAAFPPLEEQQAITRFLEEETEKMDDLESVVREAIETLELLRAGIISAAVTGKIDVREEGV